MTARGPCPFQKCANCWGRHWLNVNKCPTINANGNGIILQVKNANDRCQFQDPQTGHVCDGLGHTTGHHVELHRKSSTLLGGAKGKGKVKGKGKGEG